MKCCLWRNIPILTLLVSGIMSAPTLALAHSLESAPFRGGRLEKLVEELDLDAKTLTEVKKILQASRTTHKEDFNKLREAHARMRSLLEQEKPTEAAVMAQADTIGALETEVRKQRLRTMLRVHALLAPEQRARLLSMLRTRRSHSRRGVRSHKETPQEFRSLEE